MEASSFKKVSLAIGLIICIVAITSIIITRNQATNEIGNKLKFKEGSDTNVLIDDIWVAFSKMDNRDKNSFIATGKIELSRDRISQLCPALLKDADNKLEADRKAALQDCKKEGVTTPQYMLEQHSLTSLLLAKESKTGLYWATVSIKPKGRLHFTFGQNKSGYKEAAN